MDEVLKQALEALEVSTDWDLNATGKQGKSVQAIISLRQAIAELESQESNPIKDGWKLSVADGHSGYGVYAHMEEYPEEGAFLLLPIKELESQEPVARLHITETDTYPDCVVEVLNGATLQPSMSPINVYAHPPQRTETIQSLQCFHCQVTIETLNEKVMHLMAQRTWVGLTDEQMLECNMDGDLMIDRETAKRNVEAKLKEKNNG